MQKLSNYIADFKILRHKVYSKNLKDISFDDVTKRISHIIFIVFLISFIVGGLVGITLFSTIEIINNCDFKYHTKFGPAIGDVQWKDSVFLEYKNKADLYLSQEKFKGTPLTGEILALAAYNAYDSTGIILPLPLALAQGQWESDMGRAGRSPIKNPYNVGEHDTGTVLYFETTFEGVQAYYYLMCNDYLSCKSLNELFLNFTNCNGNRYASSQTYEYTITEQYYYIEKWLKKH
ncbi:hypothetical protein M0Q97_12995 [Candidatus Dojkabacteria bacterium]|jgi:hypothetical protein|nr:hypothetical protein [Candidatus Dojkabacteria bacterium]